MYLYGTRFSILGSPPTADFPSKIQGYSPSLLAWISAGDTIEIKRHDDIDSFIGRILTVETSTLSAVSSGECIHPYINAHTHRHNDTYLRVQLYIRKSDDIPSTIKQRWPSHSDLSINVAQLIPSVTTNLIIWCHVQQVTKVVFLPHLQDCARQVYGPMFGRTDTFWVEHELCFDPPDEDDNSTCFFRRLKHEDYQMLGYESTVESPSTYTARVVEGLYMMTTQMSSMLTKVGLISSTIHRKFPFPIDIFGHVFKWLSNNPSLTASRQATKYKQCITMPNLTLQSAISTSRQYRVIADTVDGIRALRSYFPMAGIGCKKRHPPMSAIGSSDGRNNLTIQCTDTINICDIDCFGLLDGDSTDKRRNMIRITYDQRQRRLHISKKCYVLQIGSCSDQVRSYLQSNYIEWDAADAHNGSIRVGTYIELDNIAWHVVEVNQSTDTVTVQDMHGTTKIISMQCAEDNEME